MQVTIIHTWCRFFHTESSDPKWPWTA